MAKPMEIDSGVEEGEILMNGMGMEKVSWDAMTAPETRNPVRTPSTGVPLREKLPLVPVFASAAKNVFVDDDGFCTPVHYNDSATDLIWIPSELNLVRDRNWQRARELKRDMCWLPVPDGIPDVGKLTAFVKMTDPAWWSMYNTETERKRKSHMFLLLDNGIKRFVPTEYVDHGRMPMSVGEQKAKAMLMHSKVCGEDLLLPAMWAYDTLIRDLHFTEKAASQVTDWLFQRQYRMGELPTLADAQKLAWSSAIDLVNFHIRQQARLKNSRHTWIELFFKLSFFEKDLTFVCDKLMVPFILGVIKEWVDAVEVDGNEKGVHGWPKVQMDTATRWLAYVKAYPQSRLSSDESSMLYQIQRAML